MIPPAAAELAALDAAVERMLLHGDRGDVEILGAGEITCVLGHAGRACKRLPPFDTADEATAYAALIERYVAELRGRGVDVVDTTLGVCPRDDGRVTAYVVQPRLPREALLPGHLSAMSDPEAARVLRRVLERTASCVTPTLGFDAQLSNWCLLDDRLVYLDTTTPLLRDARGADLLPTEIFVAALPTLLRGLVRRFFVRDLLSRFFDLRYALLDLLGNMANYGLGPRTAVFLAEANRVLAPGAAPLTLREIVRYRRREAVTWALIRRMLLLEQLWARRVRRSRHPLMLPWQFQRVEAGTPPSRAPGGSTS